jgi:flagellar biosynthesis/type III secretory pathway M-ring protein FliF/YscJ
MATSTQPENDADTAFLIIIALLTIIVLGLGPIVVHMHLKTEAKLEEMEQERRALERERRASEKLRQDIQRLFNEERNK